MRLLLIEEDAGRCDYIRERLASWRSEEHTSELQSRVDLVCRLLLEKKKRIRKHSSQLLNRRMGQAPQICRTSVQIGFKPEPQRRCSRMWRTVATTQERRLTSSAFGV